MTVYFIAYLSVWNISHLFNLKQYNYDYYLHQIRTEINDRKCNQVKLAHLSKLLTALASRMSYLVFSPQIHKSEIM